jgi:bacillithiol system protein YtxJ
MPMRPRSLQGDYHNRMPARSVDVTDRRQLDKLLAADRPTWLFKHSIFCAISARAFARFEAHLQAHPDQPAGIITVQHARDLCDDIAQRTGIRHQSPQAMLVRDGKVLFHTSHMKITERALADAIAQARAAS